MPVDGANETWGVRPEVVVMRSDAATGPIVRVTVRGEVDLTDGGRLGRALLEAVAQATRVEIDLAGVTFLGSHGLRSLVAASVAGQRRSPEVDVVVVGASPLVRRVLEITGLGVQLRLATDPVGAGADGPDGAPDGRA